MKWTGLILIPIAIAVFALWRTRPPEITGAKVENFALYDNQGGFFELWRKKYAKAVVIISHGSECPMMRKQIPYIENLKSRFRDQGIEFVYINPQDSAKEVEQEAKKFSITIPILLDDAQIISRGLQLTRTLEAIVIETKNWRTVYRGSISDELSFDGDRKAPQSEYLADALDDYLHGRKLKNETTELTGGCALTYNKTREITYTKHVRPILEAACITCHSGNGVPPTKLGTYEEARRWGAMIREVIRTYRMPTGGVDPNFGPYNKRQLIPVARAALVNWVESGMPEGDRSAVKETKPVERSPLKPDLLLEMKEAVSVPAQGEFNSALYELGDTFHEDTWAERIQIQIADPAQVHHASLLIMPEEVAKKQKLGLQGDGMWAKAYAQKTGKQISFNPGSLVNNPVNFPPNTAVRIPKGYRLMLEVHHARTGKVETFKPSVAMELVKCGKSYSALHFGILYEQNLRIPANDPAYRKSTTVTLNEDIQLVQVGFHMHKRGRAMKVSAKLPSGELRPIYSVPNYRYTNQRSYPLNPPLDLPRGSQITVEAVYDNSAGNPAISNPNGEIAEGLDMDKNEMLRMSNMFLMKGEAPYLKKCPSKTSSL